MNQMYFRDKELAQELRIGRSTVWYYVRIGMLNAPLKLSSRVSVWTRSDIDAFIASRISME